MALYQSCACDRIVLLSFGLKPEYVSVTLDANTPAVVASACLGMEGILPFPFPALLSLFFNRGTRLLGLGGI